MKVSIIIPIYNVAPYVEACLESVLSQTFRDFEVIIVNDCSQDNSISLVRHVLEKRPHEFTVKIVNHEKNRGLSAARNTGIRHATGDYLFFLDSDDELTPNCLELLAKGAEAVSPSPDMVIGDYFVKNSKAFFPPLKLKSSLLRGHKNNIRAYMQEKIYVMAWNKMVKREFVLTHKLFFKEGLLHEDCLWSFHCACEAELVYIVKHTTYIYKVRENSIKSSMHQHDDICHLKTVMAEMIGYADKHGLLTNRYVYSFLEEEKLRMLNTCLNYGWQREEFFHTIFSFFNSFPQPKLWNVFKWSFLKTRKCIRDAHYFLPTSLRETYYWNMPKYLESRSKHFFRLRYYSWLLSTMLKVCIGIPAHLLFEKSEEKP